MASNKVNLGIGNQSVSGMFFVAPVNTALPSSPLDTLDAAWVNAGAVSSDGLTVSFAKDSTPLRNWSKEVERLVASDEAGTVQSPLIYTEKKTLEIIFGEDNVTYSAATSSNGNITKVSVAPGVSASPMAVLFIMKDGDDMMYVGSSRAIARDLDDITFAPTEAITWTVTWEGNWTFCKDDGQVTS